MNSFEVHSNESACIKSGSLGMEQVIIFLYQKHKFYNACRYKNFRNYPNNIYIEDNGYINLIFTLHSLQYNKWNNIFQKTLIDLSQTQHKLDLHLNYFTTL